MREEQDAGGDSEESQTEADHLFCLGVEQLDNGRLKAARQTFLKVVRLGKYEGEAWLKIAHTHFLGDDMAECEKALRKAIVAEPENNAAWHILGMVLVEQGRVDKAEEAVRRSLKLNPELACVWETLAQVLVRSDRDSEALTAYATAIGLDADNPDLWRGIGRLYFDSDIYDKAQEAFERALLLDPESDESHETVYLLGRVHEATEDHEEAREQYRQVIEDVPDHQGALAGMGRVSSMLNDIEGAISYLQRATLADPDDYDSLVLLASLYENTGQNQLAENLYRVAIRTDKYREEAYSALGKMFQRLGRDEEAESVRSEHEELIESAEEQQEIDASIVSIIEDLNEMGLTTRGSCSGLDADHVDREPVDPYVAFDAGRTHAYHYLFTIADMAGWTADYGVNGWGVELGFDADDQHEREEAWQRLMEAARLIMSRVPKYYVDLFNYVSRRCDIREEDGHYLWVCKNDLSFTREYCDWHGLDFEAIKKRLNETDGYCDCEVLMNSTESIPDDEPLPR